MAEHSRETIDWDEFVDRYTDDFDVPSWKVRRLAISFNHSEMETKIICDSP